MSDPNTNPYSIEPEQPKPAAPASSPAGPGDLTSRGSLLDDSGDERCPKCGKPLPPNAVVCMACGFDMKANAVRGTAVGVEEEPSIDEPDVLSHDGGPRAKTLTVIGIVVAACALAVAGTFAARAGGFWYTTGKIVYAAYTIALHTGTGVVAVVLAAKLLEQRVGRMDLAAARMFIAVSAAILGLQVEVPVPVVSTAVKCAAAILGYAVSVTLLFRADRRDVFTIGGLHIGLFVLLELGRLLGDWVVSAAPRAVTGS